MAHALRTVTAAAVAGAAVLAITLAGCSGGAASGGKFARSWGRSGSGSPSMTIAGDGAFNGTDGCNSLIGKGTVSDGTFHFGHFASTHMACPDVDAWLSKASTATVLGDTLTILGADGSKTGTLEAG